MLFWRLFKVPFFNLLMSGDVISNTMDQLAKELIRFQQERKIVKMVEVAEIDRKLREIEESGKRQVFE